MDRATLRRALKRIARVDPIRRSAKSKTQRLGRVSGWQRTVADACPATLSTIRAARVPITVAMPETGVQALSDRRWYDLTCTALRWVGTCRCQAAGGGRMCPVAEEQVAEEQVAEEQVEVVLAWY